MIDMVEQSDESIKRALQQVLNVLNDSCLDDESCFARISEIMEYANIEGRDG